MSALVEKVARAMAAHHGVGVTLADNYEGLALAALKAMRDEARHPMFTAMIDRALQEHSNLTRQSS